MSKFDECKKVMNEWLDGTISHDYAVDWFWNRCFECKETRCHCHECPLFYKGDCRFNDLKWINEMAQRSDS